MGMKRCRLSDDIQLCLLRYFVNEITARSAADRLGIQVNSAALFYRRLREHIAFRLRHRDDIARSEQPDVEDYCYFGYLSRRRDGGGSCNRQHHGQKRQEIREGVNLILFGIRIKDGKVKLRLFPDDDNRNYLPVIRHEIMSGHLYSSQENSEGALTHTSEFYYDTVISSQPTPDNQKKSSEFNRFWGHSRQVLRKYNGIHPASIPLFLKECEFRFNYPTAEQQLERLKHWIGY